MPFNHPTIMFRRFDPDGKLQRYNGEILVGADYDFCARLLRQGNAINLPDILLKYRVHGSSITSNNWERQNLVAKEVATNFQKESLPSSIFDALECFRKSYFNFFIEDEEHIAHIFEGFRKLIAYDITHSPDHHRWYQRASAQIIFEALRRCRMRKMDIARCFLVNGRDFLIPMAMRYLELKRALPRMLRSDNWFE